MKLITKIFLSVVFIGAIATLCFGVFLAYQIFIDVKRPKTPNELAAQAYEIRRIKNINQPFVVDSITYNVTGFIYYQKKDTTLLYVDIIITNKTNHNKNYVDSFFVLKEGVYKNYYPVLGNYCLFKNNIQTLKLQYTLPKREFSYLKYDLHILSKKDTIQNGLLRFYWQYKVGG